MNSAGEEMQNRTGADGRRVVDGVWLVPDAGERIDVTAVRRWLAERRIAVGVPAAGFAEAAPPGTAVPLQVMLHLDGDGVPVGVIDEHGDGVVPGPPLSPWLSELADGLGVTVRSGDAVVWPTPVWDGDAAVLQVEEVHDLPDVVLSGTAPGRARSFASQWSHTGHRSISVGEWQLFRLDEALPEDVSGGRRDLPVVRLVGDSAGSRSIQVIADPFEPAAPALMRWPTLEVLFAADLSEAELAPLLDPHFSGASGVRRLCSSPHFTHVDAAALGVALQSPVDEHWSEGVLRALGLPTLAADIHEGRETPESWGPITRVVAADPDASDPHTAALGTESPGDGSQSGSLRAVLTAALVALLVAVIVALVMVMT